MTITIPQRGDKKKLLELSERNVRQYKVDKYKRAERLNPDQRLMQIVTELKDLLHLDKLPLHIECFDNSNIQGSDPVAACVVFKRGRPSKKDYRKFNIRSVEGPDATLRCAKRHAPLPPPERRGRRRRSPRPHPRRRR